MTAAVLGGGLATIGATAAPGKARGTRDVVEITAEHDHDSGRHQFRLDRTEVEAGWTTLEFHNETEHTHFAYLPKIPSRALAEAREHGMDPLSFYVETVTRPFQYFWDSTVPGKTPDPADDTDVYDSLFPPWFGDVTFHGGLGLTSPDHTSTTTVALDPGHYIVECYVKNDANDFHSYLGMIDHLTVTGSDSRVAEPRPTVELSLSTSGIDFADAVRPGQHVVGVRVQDNEPYANLVGHDVHLIRFDEGVSRSDVNDWMNWAAPDQFVSDGTEPTTFLGGVADVLTTDLPRTGYHHVNLDPGDYAWVAEVPDPDGKGLLRSFTVPKENGAGGR